MSDIGAVVIGRNEGGKLALCLNSLASRVNDLVYVDSGSTDQSIELAHSLEVEVVELDTSIPFTAARARNTGFERLVELNDALTFVQFVDGDCEVIEEWIDTASEFLDENSDIAAVCGRRRERYPDSSVYNHLCDIEWNTPIGESRACGGDAMIRILALRQVGGFREDLVAGEEPELCLRLRQQGWLVWRLDADMTFHDAAIMKFGQWWKRTVRTGYAYAEGSYLHGAGPERHWVRETRRAWFWGLVIPAATLLLCGIWSYWGSVLLVLYPLQSARIYLKAGGRPRSRLLQAFFLVLGKFPEMIGAMRFQFDRISGSASTLIEYK